MSLYFADEALIVTNPEVSSVRDSDRILGILSSKSKRAEENREPVKEHLLITRYAPAAWTRRNAFGRRREGNPARAADRRHPESQSVLQASNSGTPPST
ncbi:Cell division inhibitor MinD [Chromobacterium violaceum]|uniref:Cell division inhibitor MinD n=1 Tax=Chromobacterium violaceum TaxID=536 RepID=A0A447THS4_CHRVL|nr:Cell division inhibitor MinD [Chromobacterium violaceum]